MAAGLSKETAWTSDSVVVNRIAYPRLIADDETVEIIEVNWAEITRPQRNWLGVLLYIIRLANAMLSVAQGPPDRRTRALGLHYWLVECISLWMILALLHLLALASLANYPIAAATAIPISCLLLAFLSRNIAWRFSISGTAWAFLMCIVSAGQLSPERLSHLTEGLAIVYGWSHFVTAGLLGAAAISFMPDLLRSTWRRPLTRLMLAVLPYLMLSVAGAIILAIGIRIIAALGNGDSSWNHAFQDGIPYDLFAVEIAMALAISGLVCTSFGAGLHYAFVQSGEAARRWIPLLIAVTFLGLGAVLIVMIVSTIEPALLRSPVDGAKKLAFGTASPSVAQVYGLSAGTRIVFLAPLAFSPLVLALKVMADVILYVAPNERRRVRDNLHARVRSILTNRLTSTGQRRLLLVAHSQGSVAAVESVPDDSRIELLTCGSPIGTLYEDFLMYSVDQPARSGAWINLFRIGDYIGGPIKGVANQPLGSGGHTDYWSDPVVHEVCQSWLRD